MKSGYKNGTSERNVRIYGLIQFPREKTHTVIFFRLKADEGEKTGTGKLYSGGTRLRVHKSGKLTAVLNLRIACKAISPAQRDEIRRNESYSGQNYH